MKPQMFEDFCIDSIYLPFVQNVIDMTQPQQIIDAEVGFALNGNWNATDWAVVQIFGNTSLLTTVTIVSCMSIVKR